MIVLVVLLLVTVAIAFVPGLALFAIVPGLMLIAWAAWMALSFATGRTPTTEVRRSAHQSPELLGPGGPDDPDA